MVTLKQNIEQVEQRIQAAARRSGRDSSQITLIAAIKKFPAAVIRVAFDGGLRVFGENYVQEFESKHPDLADLPGAQFHLIGHLQSNKTRPAAELFQVIETVDTAKIARRLDAVGRPLEVMLEVKLSEEESKSG